MAKNDDVSTGDILGSAIALHRVAEPERRLALAVLEQAIFDLEDGSRPDNQRKAAEWMLDDGDSAMSLRWWCNAVDVSADALREKFVQLIADVLARQEQHVSYAIGTRQRDAPARGCRRFASRGRGVR